MTVKTSRATKAAVKLAELFKVVGDAAKEHDKTGKALAKAQIAYEKQLAKAPAA
jgi:hypothetical protein